MKTLDKIARQTHDLRIFTDGERRYGNLLFELCYDLVKDGRPGRPKKTFTRGVHVRVKNKGSQAHKKGPKQPRDCRGCYGCTGWCTISFGSILPPEKFPLSLWASSRGGCLYMKFSRFKWHK